MIHVILLIIFVTGNVKLKGAAFVVPTIDTETGSGDLDDADFIQNANVMENSTTRADITTEKMTTAASNVYSITTSPLSSATESSVVMTTMSTPMTSTSTPMTTSSTPMTTASTPMTTASTPLTTTSTPMTTKSIFTTALSSHKSTNSDATTVKGIFTSKLSTTYEDKTSTEISVSENRHNVTSSYVAASSESTAIISSASTKGSVTSKSSASTTKGSMTSKSSASTTKGSVINASSESSMASTTPVLSERSESSEGITKNESYTLRSTTRGFSIDLSVAPLSTKSVPQHNFTTSSTISKFSTELETSTIKSVNITNKAMENEKGGNSDDQKDDTVPPLAYILPCAFGLVVAIIVIAVFMIRRNRRKQRPVKQDDGYVLKRQRSFSNPAFMDQNIDTLAYQLNSRDSMAPSALRNKLKKYGNSFEEIDLKEEDSDQTDSKESETPAVESNFKKSSFKKTAKKPEYKSNDLLNKSETSGLSSSKLSLDPEKDEVSGFASLERAPPLPGKGQKNTNTLMNNSSGHYDVLPQRESLPIKQRSYSTLGESKTETEFTTKQSEYDILPLRTFCRTPTSDLKANDDKTTAHIPTSDADMDSVGQISVSENLNEELDSKSPSLQNNSNDDGNSVFAEKEDQFGNEAVERVKGREPATRAPSFVVLPRAPSGSMRTAL